MLDWSPTPCQIACARCNDLKANTAIIKQGVRGVRNMHLPWFWSMDVGGDSEDSEWMAESELFPGVRFHC